MSGPDHSPWKPPHANQQGSGTGQGPWRAPTAGAPAGAPSAAPGPLKTNVLGAISLALAIIGIPVAFYPPILHYGWLLLVIALVLGVIALFPKGQTKGTAIAGALVAGFGLAASLVFVLIYAGALLWSLYGFTTAPG